MKSKQPTVRSSAAQLLKLVFAAGVRQVNMSLVLAFVGGAGAALLYVFAHPVSIYVSGRTQCEVVWPDGFMDAS